MFHLFLSCGDFSNLNMYLDYLYLSRIFGVKCDRCGVVLSPHDLVMRTMAYIYHLGCFQCVMCGQPLQVQSLYSRSRYFRDKYYLPVFFGVGLTEYSLAGWS